MKLEDQVCSLELAKQLRELDVKQESLFCYQPIENEKPSVWPRNFNLDEFAHPSEDERIAAYTVAELGELLPEWSEILKRAKKDWVCIVRHKISDLNDHSFGKTEADARAKMLIHLLENIK
jgi:hypothetical protein